MHRFLPLLLCLGLIAAPVVAQNHIVNVTGFSFIDSVSGATVTTIPLGTTVEWNLTDLNAHTITSGTGFADPNLGQVFDMALNSTAPNQTWTPYCEGVYPYFCIPHFAFGMTGQIIVTGPTDFPGTCEDLLQRTAVSNVGGVINTPTFGVGNDIKLVTGGQILDIGVESASGSFDYTPVLVVAQLFTTGSSPIGPLPGLHINTFGSFVVVGIPAGPFGAPVISPNGNNYSFLLPPLAAGTSVMIQTLAVTSAAANGFFATSNGQAIQY